MKQMQTGAESAQPEHMRPGNNFMDDAECTEKLERMPLRTRACGGNSSERVFLNSLDVLTCGENEGQEVERDPGHVGRDFQELCSRLPCGTWTQGPLVLPSS